MAVYSSRDLCWATALTDDLVIHVGDVHHMVEAESVGSQPSAQQVDKREGAEVADVGEIVDCRAAGVHADGIVVCGAKLLHLL